MAGQDRQHHRSQYVALLRRIRAGIVQGAGCHPAVEHASEIQQKRGKWPSAVTGAAGSHSTWTRPAKVSRTTPPPRVPIAHPTGEPKASADSRSCSIIASHCANAMASQLPDLGSFAATAPLAMDGRPVTIAVPPVNALIIIRRATAGPCSA